jgi:hypothetical protein
MSAQIIQFPTPKPVAPFKTLDDAAWYSNFGKRLATIRKLLELSKPQMAAVFGVHPVTYHLWEGGYRARKAHQGLGRLSREHSQLATPGAALPRSGLYSMLPLWIISYLPRGARGGCTRAEPVAERRRVFN